MASLKPRNSAGKILLDQITKESFIKNVIDSRMVQGKTVDCFEFNSNRCRILSKSDIIKPNSSGIVYWMYRDCRVQDNWAIVFAQKMANKHNIPLYVFFNIYEADIQYPTKRHFSFLIEGLKHVKKECQELNIGFKIINKSPKDVASMAVTNNIGGIICDFNPLKQTIKLQKALLENLPIDMPLVQVDAHNIIPVWIASDKQEGMAKFLRPKIHKILDEYLTGFPNIACHDYTGKLDIENEIKNIDDCFKFYKPKYDVPEVQWGDGAGSLAALHMLQHFMAKNLGHYGVTSNNPSADNTSKLSPWLNFGHISAQRCALEVKSLNSLYYEQCDRYLEEIIVRKELADNFCFYNTDYDNINGAANWARESLRLHTQDKRTWTYTKEQFAKAETHDEIWNAAQLQAYQEGKIHGYLRMYWCKKILEWTKTPEEAIEYGLWLNDTFCLDGTDPNGYTGVMWSICGVHDQGWKEREIFGKIRYMVDYSLKRKFDMNAYCARFGMSIRDAPKQGPSRSTPKQSSKVKQGLKRKRK